MNAIDILIRQMIAHVNQQWFTNAVIEIVECLNRALTSLPPDGPAGRAVDDESNGGGAAGEANR